MSLTSGGEGGGGNVGKCSDTEFAAPGKNVRVRTDPPTEGQNLLGRDSETEKFPGPSGPKTLGARKCGRDRPNFVRSPTDLR